VCTEGGIQTWPIPSQIQTKEVLNSKEGFKGMDPPGTPPELGPRFGEWKNPVFQTQNWKEFKPFKKEPPFYQPPGIKPPCLKGGTPEIGGEPQVF